MKRKTYLLTLILFLLFFNGSILLISIVNLKSSLGSTRENCLREQNFITVALAKDLTALESRSTAAENVLQSLFDSYVGYYGKQNVYLELSKKGKTLYSSLPQGQNLAEKPKVPAVGVAYDCWIKEATLMEEQILKMQQEEASTEILIDDQKMEGAQESGGFWLKVTEKSK